MSSNSKLIFAPGEQTQSDAHQPSRAAQFKVGELYRSHLDANPFQQFNTWFTSPQLRGTVPETCTLSTSHLPTGRVSSRMVYLKELDDRGFVIYSNFGTSGKAHDVESNAHAALCFWWKALERQVRVEGRCERLSAEESQVYFDTRARGSRVGAWASQQSQVLEPREGDDGRGVLEGQVKEVESRWEGKEKIEVPPFWGGLRVVPDMVEFWQGRESRLHDRFQYTRQGDEGWKVERLSP